MNDKKKIAEKTIQFSVNGQTVQAKEGQSILQVCRELGIDIPTFCYDERLKIDGSCRICLVEVEGARTLLPACATLVAEGMQVQTHSEKVIEARKEILALLLSDHPRECLKCEKAGECKLQDYGYEYGVDEEQFGYFVGERCERDLDDSNPFFIIDRKKCILCGKCVRICNDLQCVGALHYANRGYKTVISTPFLQDLNDGSCVSCGNCVSVCPTGALMPKKPESYRSWEVKKTTTTCSYCGVGCQMDLCVVNNRVVEVKPRKGAANNAMLCVKGKFGYNFLSHPDRLKTPLIKREGEFVEASWEEALNYIKEKAATVKSEQGDYRFAGLSSARCTNEENYLMQKMARGVFKTNDIDHCARLCHSSTVAGLANTLGSGAMTNSIEEVLRSDVVFIIGSNTSETHPVIGAHIRQAQAQNKTKLIVADPRKIDMARDADIYMQIKPGSNIAILNAMMKVIFDEKLYDQAYIEERTENFEELIQTLELLDFKELCKICGIDPETVRRAARMYASADRAGIYYSMGVTQFASGTNGVMSVSNLALLCGQIGKESAGVNPLRGQNNVQGACDMGALPNVFTGYQKVTDAAVREKFEKAWNITDMDDAVGKTLPEIMDAALNKELRFLYIMGENPVVSDPDRHHIQKALSSLDLLVVQDIFLTETAQLADVVLPAAAFAEKEGTFTNTERRVQRVRKAIDPPGQALADWRILQKLMQCFGYDSNFESAEEIFEEMRTLTPSYAGMTYTRLDTLDGLQWPCPSEDHPGTKFLHQGRFTRGKALFVPIHYTPPVEEPDAQYPLSMTSGRNLYQYHTRTMTGRVEGLNLKEGHGYVEMGPATAAEKGIVHGDRVKVSSPRGEIVVIAHVLESVQEGLLFVPFHYGEEGANVLTVANLDPICKIPELKLIKARLEKCEAAL